MRASPKKEWINLRISYCVDFLYYITRCYYLLIGHITFVHHSKKDVSLNALHPCYDEVKWLLWFWVVCDCRCIRMALVHDLAESLVGDITPNDGVSKEEKYRREAVRVFHECVPLSECILLALNFVSGRNMSHPNTNTRKCKSITRDIHSFIH